MKGSENMTDEEKDILKKHIRYRAAEYYHRYLGCEDVDEAEEADSAYDAVTMLAYELLRTEHSAHLVNKFIDDIDEQEEQKARKEARR
nr:MAG TPA: hypothetical protein [Caudoviricetes sp.]